MKYLLHQECGRDELAVRGDEYKYIVKARRHGIGDLIAFRSRERLDEECLYRLERLDGKQAFFRLENRKSSPARPIRFFHIGWCIVDPKSIEKVLPMLCELGVGKITFIHCRRSQKNFRLDYERLERIMESSLMQSGRSVAVTFEESPGLSAFLKSYPDSAVFDFNGEVLGKDEVFENVVIGCEGGFDEIERKMFDTHPCRKFSSPIVLRSETAVVAVAGIMLS